jgi:hypothetical protein
MNHTSQRSSLHNCLCQSAQHKECLTQETSRNSYDKNKITAMI